MIPKNIGAALETARLGKGLSQRALSAKVGLPQSQISKIESGAVDARLSTVMEIARALDLELSLVPRTILSAVQALERAAASAGPMPLARPKKETTERPALMSRNPMRPLPAESKSALNRKLVLKKPPPAAHTQTKNPFAASTAAASSFRTLAGAPARALPAYRLDHGDDDSDDDDE